MHSPPNDLGTWLKQRTNLSATTWGRVTPFKPTKEKKQAPAPGQKTQRNLVQTRPKQQPPGHALKTAKHHLNPDANPAKNPPPQGGEVTSLKPLKEKKQAPAPGQKTQRNLVQTRPKQQPPGHAFKTAKHHLNPDANPAKNPPPQGAEVTSLKPLKEKKQAPAPGQKTQRTLVQTRPKQQPPAHALKTAKHHLNPDANPAKNPPPQGGEVTSLKPLKEKKQAPAPGQKTQRNLVQTRPKQQPPGHALKTAKHHLNPDANPAKNPPPQGAEVTSLKPLKEKKQAPAPGQKTQRNLVQTRPKQQPPGHALKTAKHHLNPDANPAKNPPPQGGEVTSLKPLKEKKQAPAPGQKTQRNLVQTRPKQQPPGHALKTAKHHLNPDANPAKNPPPQGAEVTSLKPLKEKKQAPAPGQKTQRNLVQTRPKQQPPGHALKTAKHHLNPDANPAKNPPPQGAEVTSLKPLKEKKQAPAPGQKTQRNLVQTRPKQQPPGHALKTAKHHLNPDANPAKNPPPQGGEVTSLKPLKEKKQAPAPGQKTQRNLVQTRPKQQPPGHALKTAKHHLNPDANPAKNPPPQGAEVTSLKPLKEKKQAPAPGQKTQRTLVQTRPKQQPPAHALKTAKHHLNPDANPAKNPPPQGGEVTSLKPLKEKKQAPAPGQKTQRNLVQTRPKQQPPGHALKTAKHHLNPDANPAKNPPPQGAEVTSLKPLKEKKQAPAPGQKTQRNLVQTRPKQQPPGHALKTAKHHLNPDANPAKNPPPQGAEVTSLKPLKEKKQAPAPGQKTQRNLVQTRPKQQPPGHALKTAKHHLNPDANPAKNPPPQGGEVTSLKPLKEKKQAPAPGQKTQRNLVQTRPKQQPPGHALKTAKHHLNPDANPAKNPPPQGAEVTSLKPLKEKKQAPAPGQKTQRNLVQTRPKQQPPGHALKTAKHHLNPDANPAKNPPPQGGEVTSLKPLKEKKQAPARGQKTQRNHQQTYTSSTPLFSPPPRKRRGVGGYIYTYNNFVLCCCLLEETVEIRIVQRRHSKMLENIKPAQQNFNILGGFQHSCKV